MTKHVFVNSDADYSGLGFGVDVNFPFFDGIGPMAAYLWSLTLEPTPGRDVSENGLDATLIGPVGPDATGVTFGDTNYALLPFSGVDLLSSGGVATIFIVTKTPASADHRVIGNASVGDALFIQDQADNTTVGYAFAGANSNATGPGIVTPGRGTNFICHAFVITPTIGYLYRGVPGSNTMTLVATTSFTGTPTGGIGLVRIGETGTSRHFAELFYRKQLNATQLGEIKAMITNEAAKIGLTI
jgi:hypothetical protein